MSQNQNLIVISATPFDSRIAVVERSRVVEIYIDYEDERPMVGNIYKGKVTRVLPGMEAAFVDIGAERAGFLHVSDIGGASDDLEYNDEDDDDEEGSGSGQGNGAPQQNQRKPRREDHAPKSIDKQLKYGQQILVQIVKAPLGTKGARVTGELSLSGRALILVPGSHQVGVSRKIRSVRERQRLKRLVRKNKPEGCGVIIRTLAEGKTDEEIMADMNYLNRLWASVSRKIDRQDAPAIVYRDLTMSLRVLREKLTTQIDQILVDDEEEHERVRRFVESVAPARVDDVILYRGEQTLFAKYGLQKELDDALASKVWLPSGGYLIIEETEALSTVDVNTGRFVGDSGLEDTVLATNLEAAYEIARQLRLRNIGGIVVLDFIDMTRAENRKKVFETLKDALKDDAARTSLQKISELGLIEMTRQRLRMSLQRSLSDPCPWCNGKGLVHSRIAVMATLYRELRSHLQRHHGEVRLYCNPDLAERLWDSGASWIDRLQNRFNSRVTIHPRAELAIDQFKLEQAIRV